MAYEMKPNTGSLFKNDRKEADSHPDYKGSALIDGLGECWLDAWINTAKDGSKYMSLKLKPKQGGGYAGSYNGDPRTNNSGGIGPQDEAPF
jgi:uncharacterized protein (DUF736 family)